MPGLPGDPCPFACAAAAASPGVGAVGAGVGGDVRAAAGPMVAGRERQRELALGGGTLSRDRR